MATIRIVDPVKSIERCYDRRHEAFQFADKYDRLGYPALAAHHRRRAAALKSAATRIARQYLGAPS